MNVDLQTGALSGIRLDRIAAPVPRFAESYSSRLRNNGVHTPFQKAIPDIQYSDQANPVDNDLAITEAARTAAEQAHWPRAEP